MSTSICSFIASRAAASAPADKIKFENDDELCWDCDEQFATHGHFCEECNNDPIMFRDPYLVKTGVCRICAEDDEQVKAYGSYGEDNVPMCEGCKTSGGFNSDGTRKGADNDSDDEDECPGCLSADCKQCDSTSDVAKEQYQQWCKDNNVDE
jgi:hypothetical protein